MNDFTEKDLEEYMDSTRASDTAEMLYLYVDGMEIHEIAKKYDISVYMVKRLFAPVLPDNKELERFKRAYVKKALDANPFV